MEESWRIPGSHCAAGPRFCLVLGPAFGRPSAGLRPVAKGMTGDTKGMTGDTRRAGGGCSGDDFWVSFLCDFAFLRGYLPGDIHAQNVKRIDIVKEIAF